MFSLYPTVGMCWFGVCWGHDTDVPRTGMCTDGFGNFFYVSLVGGGLRPTGPSSGIIHCFVYFVLFRVSNPCDLIIVYYELKRELKTKPNECRCDERLKTRV